MAFPKENAEHKDEKQDRKLIQEMMDKKKAEKSEAKKSEHDEDEDEHKKDEKKVEKSISDADLSKTADALETLVKSGVAGRKSELLQKAQNGTIGDEETKELRRLLKGKGPEGDTLSKAIREAMSAEGNETFAKALDVSDYLPELHKAVSESLDKVAETLAKSDSARQDQIVVLAKALLDVTKLTQQNTRLLKSLNQKFGVQASMPVRGPKSAGAIAELQKTGALNRPQGQLSKSEVLDTLEELFQKSWQTGHQGLSPTGESYEVAASKYEQLDQIHPALLQEVLSYRKGNGRA